MKVAEDIDRSALDGDSDDQSSNLEAHSKLTTMLFSDEEVADAYIRRRLLTSVRSFSGQLPPANPPAGDADPNDGCSFPQELLTAYADCELNPQDTDAVEKHLSGCQRCADVLNQIVTVDVTIEREWRSSVPLPFSVSQDNVSIHSPIDKIMAMLPTTAGEANLPSKRMHDRVRWTRFPKHADAVECELTS